MTWRLVGPFRGGRVLAVAGVPGQPHTYYFGAAGGGVWKTTDDGLLWAPLFDQQPAQSIGAIAVSPSDPNVIYVGTGKRTGDRICRAATACTDRLTPDARGSISGLDDTRHIRAHQHRPGESDSLSLPPWPCVRRPTATAASIGRATEAEPGRNAVHVTGRWRHRPRPAAIGRAHRLCGALERAPDPMEPVSARPRARRRHLQVDRRRRHVDATVEPGPSLDDQRQDRTGRRLRRARSARVYALIDAETPGLYRSDDAGARWELVSYGPENHGRAWYFRRGHRRSTRRRYRVRPQRRLESIRPMAAGRGRRSRRAGGDDYHALWIDPADSRG